jgi:hypothetical protein
MDANEANMWLELIKPAAEKYFDVEVNPRDESLAWVGCIPKDMQSIDVFSYELQIVVHDPDNNEQLAVYCQHPHHTAIMIKITGSIHDPSFDPTPIIMLLENIFMGMKNGRK